MLRRRCLLASLPSLALSPFSLLGCRPDLNTPAADSGRARVRLIRANIVTNDPSRPRAQAMLLRGGEIVALGDADAFAGERVDEHIDWANATVLPGLTDAHAHLLGLGQAREVVDLRGAASVEEIIARLQAAAPPEGWILGRGWDQNLWGGAMPTAAQLDAAFGERPVWLRRIDGHAGWGNSAVMKLTGIAGETAIPEGGEILRDASGAATGVLIDNAMDLVPVPEPSTADVERWLIAATREAASLGLTGVHEMGLGPEAHAVFDKLAANGQLPIRVHGYASEQWSGAAPGAVIRSSIERTRRYVLAGVKIYVDGALGSRGAALIEPYADRPDHRGALMHTPEEFVRLVGELVDRGLQVAAHAIGDLGNRTIIDAYEAILQSRRLTDPRLRIEHVQIIDPSDIARMSALGLIASMQPTHATSDMPWAEARVGAGRLPGAYAWQRMLAAGVPLAFGSDFPVEQPSPLLGLYAAVTRQDLAGHPPGGWRSDQSVTIEQAIAAFTSGAAHAAHRDDHLGMLAAGYRADLTCLDRDPTAVTASELPKLAVRATMVDGELAFEG